MLLVHLVDQGLHQLCIKLPYLQAFHILAPDANRLFLLVLCLLEQEKYTYYQNLYFYPLFCCFSI
ncbi:unnamed protein product [Schistosoma curassoni]|uniref:Ovule protein n=1 Tax=Schistosoma curassoni TaxID=6186 RepID=A0A183L0U5_9TREM|nr:unnamed protein product [Schistosoma curassoni]